MLLLRRLLLLTAFIATGSASAQRSSAVRSASPAPGQRVRVSVHPQAGWIIGAVEAVDSTRIVLRASRADAADTIRLADVRALQVRRVRHVLPRAIVGMLLGGLAGGAVGTGIGCYDARDLSEDRALECAIGGVVGLASGAAVGAVVGGLTGRDRWENVLLPLHRSRDAMGAPDRRASFRRSVRPALRKTR